MKGFILKDLIMIKNNFKIMGILLIFYLVMGVSGSMDISFILPFMSVMFMISTFSYDNFNKWDVYAVTLPRGRERNVKAKYLTTIILVFISTLITMILSIFINLYKLHEINFMEILLQNLSFIFGIILVMGLMYPVIYKFGLEKARILIIILIIGIAVVGGLLLRFINTSPIFNFLNALNNYWILILIILSLALIYFSYKISLKIVLKREY